MACWHVPEGRNEIKVRPLGFLLLIFEKQLVAIWVTILYTVHCGYGWVILQNTGSMSGKSKWYWKDKNWKEKE